MAYNVNSKQKIYAWIKQIATSNKIYPRDTDSRLIIGNSGPNIAAAA